MPVIINIMAPVKAKVGSTVTLKADLRAPISIIGNSYDIVWSGDAPGMPRPTKVIFGASWGETKTITYSFIMPDRTVSFRIMLGETNCVKIFGWCDDVRTEEYTIEPGKEFEDDPTKPPSDWFAMFGDIGKWLSGNLIWLVVSLTALIALAYIVKKKSGIKPGGK